MEQVWFVYVQDHHEGPFTASDLMDWIQAGKYSQDSYVWMQGMADWKHMREVPEFGALFPAPPVERNPVDMPKMAHAPIQTQAPEPVPVPTPTPVQPAAPVMQQTTRHPIRDEPATSVIQIKDVDSFGDSIKLPPIQIVAKSEEELRRSLNEEANFMVDPVRQRRTKRTFGFFVFLILVLGGLYKFGYLQPVEMRLRSLVATLPPLPQLDRTDYDALRSAVKTPLSSGPAVEVAVSREDSLSPILYFSTNLSSGFIFHIYVSGIRQTLLNELAFSTEFDLPTKNYLGVSGAIRKADGRVIPRGEYWVTAVEADKQSTLDAAKEIASLQEVLRDISGFRPVPKRLFFSKRVFFGIKDASYLARLKEFHDRLEARAKEELDELGQMQTLVEGQNESFYSLFSRHKSSGKFIPAFQKEWSQSANGWNVIKTQLTSKVEAWREPGALDQMVYPNLHRRVSELVETFLKMTDLYKSYYENKTPATSVDPTIQTYKAQFEKTNSEVLFSLKKLTETPKDSTGLPSGEAQ